MCKKVKVRRIPVTDLINILLEFQESGNKYVDLLCSINNGNQGDGVHVMFTDKDRKKNKKNKIKKIVLTDTLIEELLKHT